MAISRKSDIPLDGDGGAKLELKEERCGGFFQVCVSRFIGTGYVGKDCKEILRDPFSELPGEKLK